MGSRQKKKIIKHYLVNEVIDKWYVNEIISGRDTTFDESCIPISLLLLPVFENGSISDVKSLPPTHSPRRKSGYPIYPVIR